MKQHTLRPKFKVGSKVMLDQAAIENETYSGYADRELTVTHVATKYMPASEFFSKGKPFGYHPGYDAESGSALYDLRDDNGADVPFSLYESEIQSA